MKPRWSEGASPEILTPELGRKLTEEERAVLETCRACTAKDPARRIASAAEAGRMLTERRRWWWWKRRLAASKRPWSCAGALTVVAAVVAVGVLRSRRATAGCAVVRRRSESPLIVPTGEPADWTDVSTVLAEIPERIPCTRLLPDQRTIRFVWGSPPRAEDIDTVTRKRIPSPLVPAAYAEGCPDLSPDGKRLVYQGHAQGRARVRVSFGAPGRQRRRAGRADCRADDVVGADLARRWSDVLVRRRHEDMRRIFDGRKPDESRCRTSRATPYVTSFRFASRPLVFVSTVFETGETEFTEISTADNDGGRPDFACPSLPVDLRSNGSLSLLRDCFATGNPAN